MTCIVGIARNGRVTMGADSLSGLFNGEYSIRRDAKLFAKGAFLIGYTTSYRFGQIVQYKFDPPAQPDGMGEHEYMVALFVDALRDALKAGGFAAKDKDVESGGDMLVGYRGRLFKVWSDYQVQEREDGRDACGCGSDLALGAIFASEGLQWSDFRRVDVALAAAAYGSTGVAPPFIILSDAAETAVRATA